MGVPSKWADETREQQRRDVLAELGAYLQLIIWANYDPISSKALYSKSRVGLNMLKRTSGKMKLSVPSALDFLAEKSLRSVVLDKNHPAKEGLDLVVQEWQAADPWKKGPRQAIARVS